MITLNIIEVSNLIREYEYFEKEPGIKGALKVLFSKKKKVKRAVNDFSFTMKKGEFIGLIGPNGAGKTTLIKMMTGIIKPTDGMVKVAGYIPSELKSEFKKKYAVVMGQKSQLWWDLAAVDSFQLNKEIYGIEEKDFNERLQYLLELFSVKEIVHQQVRKLSLGQRMKMEIIASLLHNPEILFLDEPTIGLDIIAQKQMRKFLKRINEDMGVSIILTSHYMEDIKHLCNRVIIVNEGNKIFDDSYEQLIKNNGDNKIIHVTFEDTASIEENIEGEILSKEPYKFSIKLPKNKVNDFVRNIFEKYNVEDISIEDEDIANTIEKIYEERRD